MNAINIPNCSKGEIKAPIFIDLFAGCGGLSLGLMNAGWTGLFAVEQSPDAFKTLYHNLVDYNNHNNNRSKFSWPEWMNREPNEIARFIRSHRTHLENLKGKICLVAGGPPCQGFSFAGRRKGNDPRNELFKHHLNFVDIVQPKLVLLENVQGIDIVIGVGKRKCVSQKGRPRKSYAAKIKDTLEKHGYIVQQSVVKAVDFGVPQFRPRYFTIGIRKDLLNGGEVDFFELLRSLRNQFLETKRLPKDQPVTVHEAICDLETHGKKIIPCEDEESPRGFFEILYEGPITVYQHLMHEGLNGQQINSLRLVNHKPETIDRFKEILKTCSKGVHISAQDRERLGIKKTAIAPLSPNMPSHTLTTLPDDLLHYSEPRIHTVREHARLQSFPDWFEFRGKYTTGGDRRKSECPRYTQVGNAVPPLLAEAIGACLLDLHEKIK